MNKLFALIILILMPLTFAFAKAESTQSRYDIMIELGDEHILRNVSQKLWIENPKILSAVGLGSSVTLKPLALGSSKIRLDQKEMLVLAVPSGFKESYKIWTQLARKSAQLSVGFCEQTLCLKGEIFTLDEFKKIVSTMEEKNAFVFLKLEMSDELTSAVEKWFNHYFRNHEITPPKIIFSSSPWKAVLSAKDNSITSRNQAHQVGLFTQDNPNKIEISDNIKVSVKFVEIKKATARKLGIDWQKAIGGQILDSKVTFDQTIDLILNAEESSGNSKTLANPTLICRNGKEAEFFAGGEIPIVLTKYKTREVVWKKYGVSLKIKPVVDPLGQMSIAIETEVSTPDESKAVDGVPGISSNRVSSHFDLVKSRTIVLSGLLHNGSGQSATGLPYLTQIPMIGKLFSSQGFRESETEMVIFVTPEIFE
jgi:pilus assembly protein CpaC